MGCSDSRGEKIRSATLPVPFSDGRSGMCLILFAYRVRADAPLIVAANRDEFYARPAALAQHWSDAPHVFAGRDLTAGGTWLGVSTTGRFAAVTNFSETPEGPAAARHTRRPDREFPARRRPRARVRRHDRRRPLPRLQPAAVGRRRPRLHVESQLASAGAGTRHSRAGQHPPRRHAVAESHARHTRAAATSSRADYSADDLIGLLARRKRAERRTTCRNAATILRSNAAWRRSSSAATNTARAQVRPSRSAAKQIHFSEQTFGPQGVPLQRVDETLALIAPSAYCNLIARLEGGVRW